jgi:beta-galactosidase
MMCKLFNYLRGTVLFVSSIWLVGCTSSPQSDEVVRERISINQNWRFFKYDSAQCADHLMYDVRPEASGANIIKEADARPTSAQKIETKQMVLKPWILPSANPFISNREEWHQRPDGNPGADFPFVQPGFDDSAWQTVTLPHDWAAQEPFQKGNNPEVSGGMGRLPVNGVAWYRRQLDIPLEDAGRCFFLDVDGAMSYAMVWLNGSLVGGWPYGYNSWRLDLTPYVVPGGVNQLAIRLDNPNYSARWYPGAGLYRNVWLTKTNKVHVAQYGTYITTQEVSDTLATVNVLVQVDNDSETEKTVEVITRIYGLDAEGEIDDDMEVTEVPLLKSSVSAGQNVRLDGRVRIENPRLWGPPPSQQPNLYKAMTIVYVNKAPVDNYETRFGIRSLTFNPDSGLFVNGEHITIKGVNQHHDLGAIGAAFNTRAAERQLQILREMGCNAIRMSHNPPAPELLELTDKMGFLVMDEIFDSWEQKKTPYDFHLIFPEWSEPDLRAFVRRDRNCPSVVMWSFGNEVGEQYTDSNGAAVGRRLYKMLKEEDDTRPAITAMNFAKPYMKLPEVPDIIGLNYQGEGIRQDPMFEGTDRIRTKPQYDNFHHQFPDKMILSTETASAFSSRGIYLFPVSHDVSAPVREGSGGDSNICQVSSYELYAVDFGTSADKVFASLDSHPFVAGEFVWTGWDYLGEPTPYYSARSSYTGIIDLAGFKKDRFYLYQSRWRPDYPMVHILPHWNWPERIGEITPVHVFTSGDEVELFLNGKSLGRKKKGEREYRLRWDDVIYQPGELKAVAYKNRQIWAEEIVKTTGEAAQLTLLPDRQMIKANGTDLSFITVQVSDDDGRMVPRTNNLIEFEIEGPGIIVATDNGDPTDMMAFSSLSRHAFNGLALVIVRAQSGNPGAIRVTAKSAGLPDASVVINGQ